MGDYIKGDIGNVDYGSHGTYIGLFGAFGLRGNQAGDSDLLSFISGRCYGF